MVNEKNFLENARAYDAWFDKHALEFKLELQAIRTLLPQTGNGIEIGVGTGRFAAAFDIKTGVEPVTAMGAIATTRGIKVITGKAEVLPFGNNKYDYALMVTTDCFLDSMETAHREVFRILKSGGCFINAFIDRESALGKKYSGKKNVSKYYQGAKFHRPEEIYDSLKDAGFQNFEFSQALLPADLSPGEQPVVKKGYGEGSFVVIRAVKFDSRRLV